MLVGVIPWLHYLLLVAATVSMLFFFLLLWIWRQGISRPETKWLAALCALYGVVSLQTLLFLDIRSLAELQANNYYRLLLTHLGLLLVLGYFETYFDNWKSPVFSVLAVLIAIPQLYMITGHSLETTLELSRRVLPWGEEITMMKATYHPLATLRNSASMAMFLVVLGRCGWQVAHRREIKRHLLLAVAVLVPLVNSGLVIMLMSGYAIPMAQFGLIGFGLVMLLAILNEVTVSQRLSLEVANREAQLRFMASQVPGALYSLQIGADGKKQFLFLGDRVEDVFGFPADHPHPLRAFVGGLSPEDQARFRDAGQKAVQTLQSWTFTALFHRPDRSTIWFQVFSHISRNTSGVQSNGVVLDITERIRQERKLQKLLKEVTLRKDELEGLLFTMGHDLRSPLVTIDGFSHEALSLLKGRDTWSEERRCECVGYLRLLREDSKRMNGLIATLLMLGRTSRDFLDIGVVNIQGMLQELVQKMPFAENGLRVEIAPLFPPCRADLQQLKLVFTKVLENCIGYRKLGEEGVVRIGASQGAERVAIQISDTGIGFPNQYAEVVFRAFHQLNPNKEHPGVGLTIARLALLRMDGTIRVTSEPNVGTTCTIELPGGWTDQG
jgi:signal transduction histidine kinase